MSEFKDMASTPKSVRLLLQMKLLFQKGPLSVSEIAQEIGQDRSSIARWVSKFNKAGLIYVAKWDQPLNIFVASYAWGQLPDAPEPKARTAAEKYLVRKSLGIKQQVTQERTALQKQFDKVKPFRCPMIWYSYGH